MPSIFITRKIPDAGPALLREKGYDVDVSPKDGVLTKEELVAALKAKPYDAVLCLLTDKIDAEIFDAAPAAKIFANYAVGFDNIDIAEAKKRGIFVTNTPDVLTNTVAEHTFALMLAAAHRIAEGDAFTRAGKYTGWAPELLLGTDLSGKTLGILGLGRIGSRVAYHAVKGFGMNVFYYDVKRNEDFEKEYGAAFRENPEAVLRESDFVSVHVPLLDSTRHLINAERLVLMKKGAILVNTSRGAVIDEAALVDALKNKTIRAAALDVFEREPALASGLAYLPNVVLTPHLASATEETRGAMSRVAAENIIAALEGAMPPNAIK
ncbi:MAG: D-glycerate dehydrogenase [Parcubacteria group bacterium]|nr:D-glycerate dehydrogenase [Parcubacteria group bacterium]